MIRLYATLHSLCKYFFLRQYVQAVVKLSCFDPQALFANCITIYDNVYVVLVNHVFNITNVVIAVP